MSTVASPTFTATSTITQISEARSSVPSGRARSSPSPRYLYGIILVVVILALFVCCCTTREVLRRQRRADAGLPLHQPDEDEEESIENMVKPEMYEVYLDDKEHLFREVPDQHLEWKTMKPLSTSFVPQPPPPKHESFSAALGGLIIDNLASMRRHVQIWPKREPDELAWESRPTPMPGLVLSSVLISMPAPGRQRFQTKRPSFAMSETSGGRTIYECPTYLEETLFGIYEERWSEVGKT